MVTCNEKGFSIIIETPTHPAGVYCEIIADIIDAIECTDREVNTSNNYNALLGLLKEMMPTFEQAKKMFAE